jgi:hypothetical protein
MVAQWQVFLTINSAAYNCAWSAVHQGVAGAFAQLNLRLIYSLGHSSLSYRVANFWKTATPVNVGAAFHLRNSHVYCFNFKGSRISQYSVEP